MSELLIIKVIFSELITEFELRKFEFSQVFFLDVQFLQRLQIGRTLVIRTLVDRALFFLFPEIKGMLAMRTPVFGFRLAKGFADLKQGTTNFAANLLPTFAIVKIEELSRCLTVRTGELVGHLKIFITVLNRFNCLAALLKKLLKNIFPVAGRRWF